MRSRPARPRKDNTLTDAYPPQNDAVRVAVRALIVAISLFTVAFYFYTAWFGTFPALIQRAVLLGTTMSLVFLGLADRSTVTGPRRALLMLVVVAGVVASAITAGFIVAWVMVILVAGVA